MDKQQQHKRKLRSSKLLPNCDLTDLLDAEMQLRMSGQEVGALSAAGCKAAPEGMVVCC
jgi:hypothetical protein